MIIAIALVFLIAALFVLLKAEQSVHPPLYIRIIGAVLFLICAAEIAMLQAQWLEAGSCIDAGGALGPNGLCDFEFHRLDYVAQLARPKLYVLWTAFVVNIVIPSWLVQSVLFYGWRRRSTSKPAT